MKFAPGQTWRVFFNKDNPNNRTLHIRGIVDGEYVVTRTWSLRKGWMYAVEHVSYLEALADSGTLMQKPNDLISRRE